MKSDRDREIIPQKTLNLSPYPESKFTTCAIPPIAKKSQSKNAPPIESQFHIFKKPIESATPHLSLDNSEHSVHSSIQSSWAAFSGMNDGQRNQMLRGILAKCSSKQVDYICTMLNLKIVGETDKLHVVPGELAHRYQSKKKTRGAGKGSNGKNIDQNNDSDRSQMANNNIFNPNIYIKLLNSHIDTELIQKQLGNSNQYTNAFAVEFLSLRCKRLQTMLQTMQEIAIEVDVTKSMSLLLQCILDSTDALHATVYFMDANSEKLSVRSSTWQKINVTVPFELLFGYVALNKCQPINVYNIKTSEYYTEGCEVQFKDKIDVDCILSTPIFGDGMRVCGIIEVINKKAGNPFFTVEDEFVVKAIASMGTLLFNHSNVKQSALKKTDDIKMFLNTASMMSNELDMEDLINVIMKTAQDLVNAERSAMFLIDKEKEELWSRMARGASEIRFPMRLGIAGHVAMTGEVLNISDAYSDSRFNRTVDIKTGFRTRNILCVPMRNSLNEVIGVTQVINKLPATNSFNKEDEQQLFSFSALAAVTIEKSKVFKDMQESLDGVTKARDHLLSCLNSSDLITISLDVDGRLNSIIQGELLNISDENIKSMKLTSYQYWLGGENPTISGEIAKIYKGKAASVGKNVKFTMHGNSYFIHYSITRLKNLGAANDSKNPEVVLFLEIINDERIIYEALSRYMTPGKVENVISLESRSKLLGNNQRISYLSATITNFGAIKEALEPAQLVYVLNSFYALALEFVHKHNGIIEKFKGNMTNAIFGAPIQSMNHAEQAVQAALDIRAASFDLSIKLETEGFPAIKVGFGINTTTELCGMVGAGVQFEYSVIGESIRASEKLTQLTKLYGIPILTDEETRQTIKEQFHAREIDSIAVRGITKPITAFEILGRVENEISHDTMTTLICYELGLSEYRSRNWQSAVMHFKKAIALTDDKPSRAFVDRCRLYIDGKREIPAAGWEGIFTD